jgi:hypothetical protein
VVKSPENINHADKNYYQINEIYSVKSMVGNTYVHVMYMSYSNIIEFVLFLNIAAILLAGY